MDLPDIPRRGEYPRLDAFLTRLILRLFNDTPAIAAYYDDSAVTDESTIVLLFHQLPKEVSAAFVEAIACDKLRAFKWGDGHGIKVAYVIKPTEDEMSDLELYPEMADKPVSDDLPDPETA